MKSINKNQQGIAHVALILVVLVLVAVGFVGYRVLKKSNSSTTNQTSSQTATTPTPISSKADINKAKQVLSNTPIDSSLNSQQLNTDIKDLL